MAILGYAEKTLDIYWVDVEGGAATLMVTPAGQSILIDTGNPGTRDAGRIHEVATKQAGLKKIDFLITTHFHGDHFGGAAPLSQLMPIGYVYDNGIPVRNPDRNRQDPAFVLKVKPYKTMKVDGREVVKPGGTLLLQQADGTANVNRSTQVRPSASAHGGTAGTGKAPCGSRRIPVRTGRRCVPDRYHP